MKNYNIGSLNKILLLQLADGLTNDFTLEGWLQKMGPGKNDGFKKRWFTLDNRKLMYPEDPLVSVDCKL